MKVIMQTIVLAALTVCTVRCLTIPSSFEKAAALLEQTDQEQQSHSYGGSDGDRGYPVVTSTRDDDDLTAEEKTLALAETVYDNLAPLVQLAGALPDKKPIEGITKMKSGYSKVITTTVAARQQGDSSSDSGSAVDSTNIENSPALVVEDIPSEVSSASEGGIGKSIEKSKESGVVVGGGANQYHAVVDEDEEDEDVYDAETIVPGRGDLSQFSPSLSAKESLAIFMREQFYAASQSASGSQGAPASQPMAAKLTINDDASSSFSSTASGSSSTAEEDAESETHMREMERRLADFVEKFMSGVLQAKMHEVRVEQRANGLQDYRTS